MKHMKGTIGKLGVGSKKKQKRIVTEAVYHIKAHFEACNRLLQILKIASLIMN